MKNNISIEEFKNDPIYKLLVALYGKEDVDNAVKETTDYFIQKKAKESKEENKEEKCTNPYKLTNCDVNTTSPKHITDYPGSDSSITWTIRDKDNVVEKKLPITDETICNFLTMMYSYNEFLNNTYLYGSENVFTMFKQAVTSVLSEIFDSEKIATTLTNPVGEKTPDDIIKEIKKIYNK
jgi:hypothetical protein